MTSWTKLTPGEETWFTRWVTRVEDAYAIHLGSDKRPMLYLDAPEMLTLAHQVPELAALIGAARKTRDRLVKDYKPIAEERAIAAKLGTGEWESFMPSEYHWLNDTLAALDLTTRPKPV